MEIKNISIEQLKSISDESLVLQGCGGDLQEWVDGINKMLSNAEILKDGAKFTDVSTFEHDGVTNLLFNMKDVTLDMGKLAMWRLQTRAELGSMWLSDYLQNRLGVEMGKAEVAHQEKPDCELIGQDSNVFNLIGIASKTLKNAGLSEQAKEMSSRVMDGGSYDDALNIIGEYVNITGPDEQTDDLSINGY